MSMTARTRLMIWHVVLYALTLGLAAALCHGWVRVALDRHHDDQLLESAGLLAASIETLATDRESVASAVRSSGMESHLTVVLVRATSGELIYESSVFHIKDPTIGRQEALSQAVVDRPGSPRFLTVTFDQSHVVRFVSVPIRSGGLYLQLGMLAGDVESWVHSIEFWSLILVPMILVLTSLSSWISAGRFIPSAAR